MTKKSIRCYKAFANVSPNVYNYEVYYLAPDGWSKNELYSCLECGELFFVDWENPDLIGQSILDLVENISCPTCRTELLKSIADYPEHIKLANGIIGHFSPSSLIPPDNESLILDIYQIKGNPAS